MKCNPHVDFPSGLPTLSDTSPWWPIKAMVSQIALPIPTQANVHTKSFKDFYCQFMAVEPAIEPDNSNMVNLVQTCWSDGGGFARPMLFAGTWKHHEHQLILRGHANTILSKVLYDSISSKWLGCPVFGVLYRFMFFPSANPSEHQWRFFAELKGDPSLFDAHRWRGTQRWLRAADWQCRIEPIVVEPIVLGI